MCYLGLAFLFKFVNHAEVLKKIALIKVAEHSFACGQR